MFQDLRARGHLQTQQQVGEPLHTKCIVLLFPLLPSHQDDSSLPGVEPFSSQSHRGESHMPGCVIQSVISCELLTSPRLNTLSTGELTPYREDSSLGEKNGFPAWRCNWMPHTFHWYDFLLYSETKQKKCANLILPNNTRIIHSYQVLCQILSFVQATWQWMKRIFSQSFLWTYREKTNT